MSRDELAKALRKAILLPYTYWLLEGEIGEGHEEEIVDKYLARETNT